MDYSPTSTAKARARDATSPRTTTSAPRILGMAGIPKPQSVLSKVLASVSSSLPLSPMSFYPEQQQEEEEEGEPQQQQQQLPGRFQLPLPTSLNSGALPRGLLGEHDVLRSTTAASGTAPKRRTSRSSSRTGGVLPRPYRAWSLGTTNGEEHPAVLRKVPTFAYSATHLLRDTACIAVITEVPPSHVLVRISECLRRRSIAVEYDEDTVTAQCLLNDTARTHFSIQVYRTGSSSSSASSSSRDNTTTANNNSKDNEKATPGKLNSHGNNATTTTTTAAPAAEQDRNNPDADTLLSPLLLPTDSILVEVSKQNGNSMVFYKECYHILMAAKGLQTGNDADAGDAGTAGIGMGTGRGQNCPVQQQQKPTTLGAVSRVPRSPPLPTRKRRRNVGVMAEEAWEAAVDLIEKDRFDCQLLGLERLVHLTTPESVGAEIARWISNRVLLLSSSSSLPQDNNTTTKEYARIVGGGAGATTTSTRRHSWQLLDCLMHPGAEAAFSKEKVSEYSSTNNNNDGIIRSFLESSAPLTKIIAKNMTGGSDDMTRPTPSYSIGGTGRGGGGTAKNSRNNQHHYRRNEQRSQSLLARKKSSTTTPSNNNLTARALSTGAIGTMLMTDYRSSDNVNNHTTSNEDDHTNPLSPIELRHEAKLRALALQVFCNSLDTLAQNKELRHVLYDPSSSSSSSISKWVSPAFLLSLVHDLQGAGRPPSVSETGYKLASVHEAALAVRALRLLAGYYEITGSDTNSNTNSNNTDDDADGDIFCEDHEECVRNFLRSEAVLDRLEYARSYGRATHAVLQAEAEYTYNRLTEDVRSC